MYLVGRTSIVHYFRMYSEFKNERTPWKKVGTIRFNSLLKYLKVVYQRTPDIICLD